MKKTLMLSSLICISGGLVSQTTGQIQGTIHTMISGEPVKDCLVILIKEGTEIAQTKTNYEGSYYFAKIDTGRYELEARYAGHEPKSIVNLEVEENKITVWNIKIKTSSGLLDECINLTGKKGKKVGRILKKILHSRKLIKSILDDIIEDKGSSSEIAILTNY